MAEDEPFDIDAIEGLKTPVLSLHCDEQFPFRECRLFILDLDGEDEYIFVCETCHERRIRERIGQRWSEAELLEMGEQAFEANIRNAGDDRDARREAIVSWVGFQLMKRKDAPPGDPRIN